MAPSLLPFSEGLVRSALGKHGGSFGKIHCSGQPYRVIIPMYIYTALESAPIIWYFP